MASASDTLHLTTPEDFLRFNSDLAIASSAALLSGAVSYGVYLVLTLMALRELRKRSRLRAMPISILYWTILFLWAIFTVAVSLQVASSMLLIRWPRLTSSGTSLNDRYNVILGRQAKLQQVMYMLQPIPYMAADAIPIWRAYVFWSHSRAMRTFLCALLVINIAVCIARSILEYLTVAVKSLHPISPFLYPIQLAFSVAANGAATIAIGIRAWHHRVLMKEIRNTASGPVYILLVVVEAGAFLCVTQITNLTIFIVGVLIEYKIDSPFLLAASVLSAFGDTVAAAYPALIVNFLSVRGSVLENTTSVLFSTVIYEGREMQEVQQGGGRLTSIQFAVHSQSLEPVAEASRSSLDTERKSRA
ncbi:hypothetical protein DL96DRAFT_1635725 [Flagelloscypha sp. PMI_526]|nr:hypothetical protein DL96DRAFT_1635725 [Flagelloscypha sp. PMI_526]